MKIICLIFFLLCILNFRCDGNNLNHEKRILGSASDNLLQNGDFESGCKNWIYIYNSQKINGDGTRAPHQFCPDQLACENVLNAPFKTCLKICMKVGDETDLPPWSNGVSCKWKLMDDHRPNYLLSFYSKGEIGGENLSIYCLWNHSRVSKRIILDTNWEKQEIVLNNIPRTDLIFSLVKRDKECSEKGSFYLAEVLLTVLE